MLCTILSAPVPAPAPARKYWFSYPASSRSTSPCILVSRILSPCMPVSKTESSISSPSAGMFVSRPVMRRKAVFPMSSLPAPKDPKDPEDCEDSEEDKYTAEEESTLVSFVEKVMQKILKEMQSYLVTLLCGGAGAYVLKYLPLRLNDNLTGKSTKDKVVLEGEIIEVGLFSTTLLDCNNKTVTVSNLAFEGEGPTISKYQYWKVTVTLTLKTFKKERLYQMIWVIRSCLKGYKDFLENEVGHIQLLGIDDNDVIIGVNYGITTISLHKLTDLNKELLADLSVALKKICVVEEKIEITSELC